MMFLSKMIYHSHFFKASDSTLFVHMLINQTFIAEYCIRNWGYKKGKKHPCIYRESSLLAQSQVASH